MTTLKEKLKEAVRELLQEGRKISGAALFREYPDLAKRLAEKAKSPKLLEQISIQETYQVWYSKTLPVVRQILPDRYQEFMDQYRLEKRTNKDIDILTYTISDYLVGIRITRGYMKEEVVNPYTAFSSKFAQQLAILGSCLERIDSVLSDIQGTLQAELFDDELSAAQELMKKGHLRAAGALAGVTIERHFSTVAGNRAIKIRKKTPTIADFNDAFKDGGVYDVPTWRFVQRLGDIRNLAVHFKSREPTKDEVEEMIGGVQKALKTIT